MPWSLNMEVWITVKYKYHYFDGNIVNEKHQ